MNETSSALPPPPRAARTRRLHRSADDRKIAGVAGGLARHFDVDAAFVRLGFVALALFGGSGLVLYVVAWLIVPMDRDDAPAAPPVARATTDPHDIPPPITFYPMV